MPAPPSESGAPLPDPRRIAAARGGTVIRSRPVSPRWAPALSAAAAPPLPPAPPRGGRSDARHVLLRLPFLGPLRDGVHVGHQDGVLVHCFAGVSRRDLFPPLLFPSRRRASWEPGAVENLEVSLKHIRSKRIKCYLISSLISKVSYVLQEQELQDPFFGPLLMDKSGRALLLVHWESMGIYESTLCSAAGRD
ncbi:uncharacterized protein [Miscanthus floridulus]|uniref:uncharacterized protein isoform X3 n=1 Tax=Miscanthus floridulus TaxID=154761 RepID=UPI00345AA1F8